jgi:hypothetical protein
VAGFGQSFVPITKDLQSRQCLMGHAHLLVVDEHEGVLHQAELRTKQEHYALTAPKSKTASGNALRVFADALLAE